MSSVPAHLRLYLRLALLRRRLLLRQTARRLALAMVAAIVLLVGLALLNIALFLVLRPLTGDLGAVLIVAGLHVLAGGVLAFAALREPEAAAMEALTEAEADALAALQADAGGAVEAIASAERRIEQIGANLAFGRSAVTALASLVSQAMPASPGVTGGDSAGAGGTGLPESETRRKS